MAKVGRPTTMDELTLQKLEGAFADGATDEEACFVASIGTSTLYNYQKEHPEFVERKEGLKNMLKYQAKSNIASIIRKGGREGLDTAKWYAERKMKGEFSTRTENTGKDGTPLFNQNSLLDELNDKQGIEDKT